MALRICIGGATGWTGSALVNGVRAAADLELAGAVARKAAGQEIDGVKVAAKTAAANTADAAKTAAANTADAAKTAAANAVDAAKAKAAAATANAKDAAADKANDAAKH